MTKVFVSGTTGFLGSHFLVNFLGREISHAYVLVRGKDEDMARRKLLAALRKASHSYLNSINPEQMMEKITILLGDISKDSCGLGVEEIDRLTAAKVDVFWHYAASLNFEDYKKDHIHTTNIDGAANAILLASRTSMGHFAYISTAYTCGTVFGDVPEEMHPMNRRFNNYYEESKCNAERMIAAECDKRSMPLSIFRPSAVVGNSQTKRTGGSDSGLYGLIREICRLKKALSGTTEVTRIFGLPHGQVNFVPVDVLMEDLRYVISRGLKAGDIYHLACDENPHTVRIIEHICAEAKIDNLIFVERDQSELSALERLLARKTVFYSHYLGSYKNFERKIPRPSVMSDEDLRAYIVEGVKAFYGEDVDRTFERSEVIASDSVPLNTYRIQKLDAPTILLCNAAGMPVEFFRPLAEGLSEKYDVITWESRTLPSLSPGGDKADVSLDRHVQDATDVLEAFGRTSRVVVVGWCTGARLAMRIAALRPDIAGAVVMMNGGYNLEGCTTTTFEASMATVMPRIASDPKYAAVFHKAIFSRKGTRTSQAEADAQVKSNNLLSSTAPKLVHLTSIPFHSAENLYRYARLVSAFVTEPVIERELNPSVPVLVITGNQDVTTSPENSRLVFERMTNTSFLSVDGADHFALYEDEKFQRSVLSFVDSALNAGSSRASSVEAVSTSS